MKICFHIFKNVASEIKQIIVHVNPFDIHYILL